MIDNMETNIKIESVKYDSNGLPTVYGNLDDMYGFTAIITRKTLEEIASNRFEFDESLGCSIVNGIAYLIEIMCMPLPIKIKDPIDIDDLASKSKKTGDKLYLGLPVVVYMHMLGQIASRI